MRSNISNIFTMFSNFSFKSILLFKTVSVFNIKKGFTMNDMFLNIFNMDYNLWGYHLTVFFCFCFKYFTWQFCLNNSAMSLNNTQLSGVGVTFCALHIMGLWMTICLHYTTQQETLLFMTRFLNNELLKSAFYYFRF